MSICWYFQASAPNLGPLPYNLKSNTGNHMNLRQYLTMHVSILDHFLHLNFDL